MAYYRICPHCGARLDPGERCECEHEKSPSPAATSREAKTNHHIQYISFSERSQIGRQGAVSYGG